MSRTTRTTWILAAFAAAAAATAAWCPGPARAAESRTPISAPRTISASGSYVLTRDIAAADGTITVTAGTVSIDLNGHTVLATGSSGTAVAVNGPANATLRNGRIYGGRYGLYLSPASGGSRVTVSHVEFEASTLAIVATDPGELVVEDATIHDVSDAVHVTSTAVPSVLRFVRNDVRAFTGIVLNATGLSMRGAIEDNVLRLGGGDGLSLTGDSRGASIARNRIAGAGTGITLAGPGGHVVEDNVITQGTSNGITVGADNCHVFHNAVTACAGTGILVNGSGVLVDSNLVNANLGYGLLFGYSAQGGIYRDNVTRGNAIGDLLDPIFSNTDAGGNQ